MADNTFKLNLLTPEAMVYGGDVRSTVARGSDGYLGILPKHAPLLTSLEIGILTATDKDGNDQKFALNGGFLEVVDNVVTVLVETAEHADDIDILRAQAARERAQKRLDERPQDVDVARAEIALKKAVARLQIRDR